VLTEKNVISTVQLYPVISVKMEIQKHSKNGFPLLPTAGRFVGMTFFKNII